VGTGRQPGFGPNRIRAKIHAFIWGIRYGVTDNFTVGLIPKYFYRKAEPGQIIGQAGAVFEPKLQVAGIGDTVFLTKYRLWGKRRAHLSVYHLLSIPTGDDKAEDRDGDVVRRIPLGSGSYDFCPGLAFTSVLDPLTLHAGVWYWIGDRQAGNEFHLDFGLTLPAFHNFYSLVELNYRWSANAEQTQLIQRQLGRPPGGVPPGQPPFEPTSEEVKIRLDGGHTLFVSPGFQYFITKTLKAEFGLQIPVIKPDDGWAEDVIFHVGIMKYLF
jgi:hypothetical protein